MTHVVTRGADDRGQCGTGYKGQFCPVMVRASVLEKLTSPVEEVIARYHFTLVRCQDGSVWAFGGNENGELAQTDNLERLTPVRIHLAGPAVKLAAAGASAMALLADGRVQTWGANGYGQTGDGEVGQREGKGTTTPFVVPLPPVEDIAAAGFTMLALDDTGVVHGWGEDEHGQLGQGSTAETRPRPVVVILPKPCVKMAVGGVPSFGAHSLFLLEDGSVWGCGKNGHGELGHDTAGKNVLAPVQVAPAAGWTDIQAGVSASYLLDDAGILHGCGSNEYGELAQPEQLHSTATLIQIREGVVSVSAGFRFALIIDKEGSCWGWGDDRWRCLGDGSTERVRTPVRLFAGVLEASAGECHVALRALTAPAPIITVTPGPGSLSLAWRWPAITEAWTVKQRVTAHPPGMFALVDILPYAARTVTIHGLQSGVGYEVLLQNHAFGPRVVTGTPL